MTIHKASAEKNIRRKVTLFLAGWSLASVVWGQALPQDEEGEALLALAVVEENVLASEVDEEDDARDRREAAEEEKEAKEETKADASEEAEENKEEDEDESEAQPMGRYEIELDAPRDIRSFLEKYLDLYRMQKRKDLLEEDFLLLLDQTPQNVQALLKTQGYFSAQAEVQLIQNNGETTVRLTVSPGQQVVVAKVEVRVTGGIEQDEAMMAQFQRALKDWLWRLPEGQPFDQTAWDDSKRRVLDHIVSRRYAAATITDSKAEIDPETHQATLTLSIDSGSAYVFGEITIIGLKNYPEKVVREQIRLKPGSDYRRRDLLDMQSELQNLPYFAGVVVEAIPGTEEPYVTPVNITVQEVPHSKLDLSVGYSTNYGLRLQTKYTYNNILNRGWIFDNQLDLSERKQQAEIGLSFPKHISGYGHRVYAAYNDNNFQGIHSLTGRLGVSRAKSHDKIERLMSVEFIQEERRDDYGNKNDLKALPFHYRWIKRDARAQQRNSRSGKVFQLEGSVALKGLLSDESFIRLYGRGMRYWPVGRNHMVMARLEAGQTFTKHPEKVPTDYLFRAGGSNSVRGYDYHSLGVMHRATAWPGRVLATGSLEYQHMVYKDWRAVVFADYGNAADRWVDWRGKTGVGVGGRWVSPVGMLGADLAYGVDDKAWRFYFSLGMSF